MKAIGLLPAALAAVPMALAPAAETTGFEAERGALLRRVAETHPLNPEQRERLAKVFRGSRAMGQGNPAVSAHPATPAECREQLERKGIDYLDPVYVDICGAPYMAPLHRRGEDPRSAKACIDQFEFPDIPCEYPVVWASAREAALACEAMGKRLCDAHEWEGACAGSLEPPDYRFDLGPSQQAMRAAHNRARKISWSYGDRYRTDVCGTASLKSEGCDRANQAGRGIFEACGSNTYPAGFFPECRSALGAYDLHGNAAEHMNLPLRASEMASRGGSGVTEMKGSWFAFNRSHAHEDDCRWRAPFWHGTKVMDPRSHANYHLGFRCCKSVE